MSDFSDFSRKAFEAYIGQKLERFPEDIYISGRRDGNGGWKRTDGPCFQGGSVTTPYLRLLPPARARSCTVDPELKFGATREPGVLLLRGGRELGQPDVPRPGFRLGDARVPELRLCRAAGSLHQRQLLLERYARRIPPQQRPAPQRDRQRGLDGRATSASRAAAATRAGCWADTPSTGACTSGTTSATPRSSACRGDEPPQSDGLMVFDIVHIIHRDWWGASRACHRRREPEAAAAARPAPTLRSQGHGRQRPVTVFRPQTKAGRIAGCVPLFLPAKGHSGYLLLLQKGACS